MNIHHEEMKSYDFKLEETLDKRMIIPHFTQNNSQLEVAVNCTNRSIGTLFGSYITQSQGNDVKKIHIKSNVLVVPDSLLEPLFLQE